MSAETGPGPDGSSPPEGSPPPGGSLPPDDPPDPGPDSAGASAALSPVSIDVGGLVRRTVASLYSHLVTRPTGRAVRTAIERRTAEAGARTLSVVDLSEVRVLDFSCADEVVAKLLLRFAGDAAPVDAFFLFRGVGPSHRGPIEEVLRRHSLSAVVETEPGTVELLGSSSADESRVWSQIEEYGRVGRDELGDRFPDAGQRAVLARLARRRLVIDLPERSEYRALSTLVPGAR